MFFYFTLIGKILRHRSVPDLRSELIFLFPLRYTPPYSLHETSQNKVGFEEGLVLGVTEWKVS